MEGGSEGHGGPLPINKNLWLEALPPPGPPASSVKIQEQDGNITSSSESTGFTCQKKKS